MLDTRGQADFTDMGGPPGRRVGLRVYLLGQFRVAIDGRPLPDDAWPLRKARALVKLLALSPGHRLEREAIVGQLWPDLPPAAASNNLRYALHVARRPLPPGMIAGEGKALALHPGGPVWVDVEAFEAAAAVARRGRDPGDYGAALDLHGGELLPDDRYEDWTVARRDALRALYLLLLADLAAIHEASGAWTAAITALQRALAEEPAHEDAHIALMRLYALAGQRGQALRQWDLLAAALRRQLDAAPGAASRALREEIAAGRFPPAAAGDPAPDPPGGRGGSNLPVPLTSLIGRAAALVAVKEALAHARLVTLIGAGGCGKTRLSLAVAADLIAAYPDGVWQIDLTALTDPTLVPGSVAKVLALREEPGQQTADRLAFLLREKAALLVLDNCEHLVAACAALVGRLLASCPRLRIIATSREALGLPGELLWRVPSLPLPPEVPPSAAAPARDLADLARNESVRLFIERARQRRGDFALTRENAAAVVEICRRLDGIPLALELAAARIGVLTVEQIAARLDDALGTLVGRNRTAPSRQQTLRGTLDWSYQLLNEAERVMLRRLAVFSGGWSLAAAEAVCGDAALDLLEGLVDKSLIVAEQRGEELRYRMLEVVRQYAAELLAASGPAEEGAIRRAHATYYLHLAEATAPGLTGPEQRAGFDRLETEHDNLRAVLRWALHDRDAPPERLDIALGLGGLLWRFWRMRNHLNEGRRWLALILAGAPGDPAAPPPHRAPLLAAAHYAAGVLALAQSDVAAQALLERGLAIQRASGDRAGAAQTMISLGYLLASIGDHPAAVALLEESAALFRALGNTERLAGALDNLGWAALLGGDYPRGRAALEACLDLARAARNPWRIASCLNNLGDVRLMQGDVAAALAMQAESLTLSRDAGSKLGIFWALEGIARALGAHPATAARAARLYGAGEYLRVELGSNRLPAKRALHEHHVALARAHLADAEFVAAWEAGRLLPLDAAIAEALAAAGAGPSPG